MNDTPSPDPSQGASGAPSGATLEWDGPDPEELGEVRQLFNSLSKAVRAHQLYDENNPVYQRFVSGLESEFRALWSWLDTLAIQVQEDRFVWKEEEVYRSESRADSLAFLFYKDGVRDLIFEPGIEGEELKRLLGVIHQARNVRPESDDLLTILWDEDLEHFAYNHIDVLAEGVDLPLPGGGAEASNLQGILESEVGEGAEAGEEEEEGGEEGAGDPSRPPGQVSTEDFNPTLYSLDPQELKKLRADVEEEMNRDLRRAVLAALFDRLEEPANRERQSQILEIFRTLLPNFLSRGKLRPAAAVLHELNSIRGAEGILDEQRQQEVEELLDEVSRAETVREMVRALRDGSIRPDPRSLGIFLRFLKPDALAPLLWASETQEEESVATVLRESVRALAEKHPSALVALLDSDDPVVVAGAARLAGDMQAAEVAPRLADLLEHPLPSVRLAALEAAVALKASTAASAVQGALRDPERDVRIQAARALGSLGYTPAAGTFREILSGKEIRQADVTEMLAFFESYGDIGDPDAVDFLDKLLNGKGFLGRRESEDVRASAALALGRVGGAGARSSLERARGQDAPVVRSAVTRALRALDAGS